MTGSQVFQRQKGPSCHGFRGSPAHVLTSDFQLSELSQLP